ncbi:ABC-type hemin transport system [Vibrio ishigakensis]|uniref:ABC-type hemin transport system n=1 Tax=Vibrio ishigakensis TaxID=1481914 RepID=A0A0B8PCW4_9VIBR|nr:ABC-type hemin transport system [Vibrio ishigakensis]
MSGLSLSQVSFERGNYRILQDINLEVGKGQLLGIIGPNGAGKSTLIKLLGGYHQPSLGQCTLDGNPLKNIGGEQRAKRIAYLPQSSQVEFPYSVSEVVSLGLQNSALSRSQKIKSINQYLAKLDIEHLAQRQINSLSGGEQQLVHIARILAQKTDIILLDEPCSSLDIGHEAQLMNLLHGYAAGGKSVVVALHNLNTAAEFCDKILLMDKGNVIAFGKPSEVLVEEHLHRLYPHNVAITYNPQTGNPNILPIKK